MKNGILLINLGTPENSSPKAVRKYLKEFLSDPRVIDIPALFRWLLLYLFILPFRTKKTAAAYQKVWTQKGSPLLVYSQALTEALSLVLGENYQVALGMRYGEPSILSAIHNLKSTENLIIFPLFPQYSSAATGSALEKALSIIKQKWNVPNITVYSHFYDHPGFIKAYTSVIKKVLSNKNVDLVLFSYHGLPQRHINKSECQVTCDKIGACPSVNSGNFYCYRAQCYATTKAVADALNLPAEKYEISFQSRLGRSPWIKPYTDLLLPELAKKGIKNIAIVCPSFVADCLETLEEIDIRAKAQWKMLGGHELTLVPSLNVDPVWVNELAEMLK